MPLGKGAAVKASCIALGAAIAVCVGLEPVSVYEASSKLGDWIMI